MGDSTPAQFYERLRRGREMMRVRIEKRRYELDALIESKAYLFSSKEGRIAMRENMLNQDLRRWF